MALWPLVFEHDDDDNDLCPLPSDDVDVVDVYTVITDPIHNTSSSQWALRILSTAILIQATV